MCSMLILLDSDGGVVGTLPYEEPPDVVLVEQDDGWFEFEFEAMHGEDHIFRLARSVEVE